MKKVDRGIKGLVKRVYLKYFVGYKNPQKYWNTRWSIEMQTEKASGTTPTR